MRLAVCLPRATLLLMTFILLTAPLLTACSGTSTPARKPSTSPKNYTLDKIAPVDKSATADKKSAGEDPEEPLPVVFIPGIQGSELVAAKDSRVLWPPGGQGKNVGVTDIPSIRDDFFRLSLNPKSEHETIYPTDVIRSYGSDQFYSLFLDFLTKSGGYVEYDVKGKPERRTASGAFTAQKPKPSLFVFAYDWRLPIEENAYILSEYVEVVAKFYPGKKVNIVTHSMGGLVARRYIIDHPDKVNKLITIAAPFLGSVKPLYQMIYGKLSAPVSYGSDAVWASIMDTLTGAGLGWGGPITEMLNFFPGVHELMSSEAYFALGGPPYTVIEPGTTAGYVTGFNPPKALSFEQLMGPGGKVDGLFPSQAKVGNATKTPASINRGFHAYIVSGNKQDDWSGDTTGVKYYHVIGVQDSGDTPLSLREAPPGSPALQIRQYALNELGPGDGTVPLLSAARIGLKKNFNAPNAKMYIYTGGKLDLSKYGKIITDKKVTVYKSDNDEKLEHTGIMTNPRVWAKVLELLREEDKPLAVSSPSTPTQPTPSASAVTGRWVLAETKLPTLPKQPILWSDQFGDNAMTINVSDGEISSKVITSKQGKEVGISTMTLRLDKLPAELTPLQKAQWRAAWEITGSGVPRYSSSFVELRQGEFQGKNTPISLKENPKGSVTFEWGVPNIKAGTFELSARLSVRGDIGRVRWVYRAK